MNIVHPLEPIVDENIKILILGSFPSVLSRINNFYYGNPKNRFWGMLEQVLDTPFVSLSNEEKRKKLLAYHIGLYDVVYSCTILGSSDASIKNVRYSDIPKLLKNTKDCKILCNGKKSFQLFCKAYPELSDTAIDMPSTSQANAACKMNDLIESYSIIKGLLA